MPPRGGGARCLGRGRAGSWAVAIRGAALGLLWPLPSRGGRPGASGPAHPGWPPPAWAPPAPSLPGSPLPPRPYRIPFDSFTDDIPTKWLVQSRPPVNPPEERLQESSWPPRVRARCHPGVACARLSLLSCVFLGRGASASVSFSCLSACLYGAFVLFGLSLSRLADRCPLVFLVQPLASPLQLPEE